MSNVLTVPGGQKNSVNHKSGKFYCNICKKWQNYAAWWRAKL